MIKITHNGRPFDPQRFGEELMAKGLELGMQAIEEKARAAASSIVDPETKRYADVFVDRVPGSRVQIRTKGSPAYARLLEKALGVGLGEIESETPSIVTDPYVYLAHATEDKPLIEPLAAYLMANGIDVFFDKWDIRDGESLPQAMEEGLGRMTHFLVMLTPTSIKKPWVRREIDVGITRLVGGKSRMMPLRVGVEVSELSEFLQTLLCREFDPASEDDRKSLVARLHGVSEKPVLGPKPHYVRSVPPEEDGFSDSARAIARHLVEASEHGLWHDPARTPAELAAATGLATEEVMLGTLDLEERGMVQQSEYGDDSIWGTKLLFVEFDAAYMGYDPAEDGLTVANRLVSEGKEFETEALAAALGWAPRRMNSAIAYLERVGALELRDSLASDPWRSVFLTPSPRTTRFVRNHA
jgi:hypothetical protein